MIWTLKEDRSYVEFVNKRIKELDLGDKVIYFDERQDFLKEVYPDAEYVPFPCFPVRRGNKQESRKRLGLPVNTSINIIGDRC